MAGDLHPIFFVEEAVKAIGLVNAHGGSLIPGPVLHSWVVMGVLIVMAIMATKKLSLVPRGLQNFFEILIESLENFVVANMGEDGRKVFPVLITLFVYILFSNYEGLIPGFDAPTANINTTLSMAVFVFVYYQYWGFKLHGIHYFHHFTGPVPWLAPLIFPIEVIGHFARMLSLSLRLFGNIKGEEIVLVLLFILAPIVSTVPIYFLFMLLKVIQALVFFMLSMLYLKGAFEEAH